MTSTLDKVHEVANACASYGHQDIVILSGVPATGKTHIAQRAAERVSGHPGLVRRTQFHPGYSYEDFMEGLRPLPQGGYAPEDGIFLQWNSLASNDPSNRYTLLIEEFSRADIASVLGELMTFVEHRGEAFVLPVSGKPVAVASNLLILATMNPRDRSALEIDEAMLRRLRIIDCPPDKDQLREMLSSSLQLPATQKAEITEQVVQLFAACEAEFSDLYLSEMPFGHGMFADVATVDQLYDLWEHKIRRILFRPQGLVHPFGEFIRDHFPWRSA